MKTFKTAFFLALISVLGDDSSPDQPFLPGEVARLAAIGDGLGPRGFWFLVYGSWLVAHGLRFMVHGSWFRIGQRNMV